MSKALKHCAIKINRHAGLIFCVNLCENDKLNAPYRVLVFRIVCNERLKTVCDFIPNC